jgi:hypothetical protein
MTSASFTKPKEVGIRVDGSLSPVYCPLIFLELEVGNRFFISMPGMGRIKPAFSNITSANTTLDEAKAFRVGFFCNPSGGF